MNEQESLFTIQDSNGRYVNEHSIWYEKETGKWHYSSKEHYTGIKLYESVERAEDIIKLLNEKIHSTNVLNGEPMSFSIKRIL